MSLFKGEKPHLGAYKVTPFQDDTETAITIIPLDAQYSGKYIDCQNNAGTSLANIDANGNFSGNFVTTTGGTTLGGVITLTGELTAGNNNLAYATNTSSTVGGIGTNGWIAVSIGGATRYIALGGNKS